MILSGNLNEAVAQEEDEEEKACVGHRDADDFEKTRRETPAGGDADQQETKDLGRTKLTGDGNITCPCVGLEGKRGGGEGGEKKKLTERTMKHPQLGITGSVTRSATKRNYITHFLGHLEW